MLLPVDSAQVVIRQVLVMPLHRQQLVVNTYKQLENHKTAQTGCSRRLRPLLRPCQYRGQRPVVRHVRSPQYVSEQGSQDRDHV
jgi:hypothetical protein